MMAQLAIIFTLLFGIGVSCAEDIKIVGGTDANPGQFPYQVSFFYTPSEQNFCGGTIFSETVIITAAHCCQGVEDEPELEWEHLEIVAGELNLDKNDNTEQRKKIADHVIHPQYNPITMDNDVCLLFLEEGLDLTGKYAKSLPLATQDPLVGSECTISGWGLTSEYSSYPPKTLQWTKVNSVSFESCQKSYAVNNIKIDKDKMICGAKAGRDSCQGDSGGPFVFNNTLVGVTSFGIGCAQPGYPGVYARIPQFHTWITDVAKASAWSLIANKKLTLLIPFFLLFVAKPQ